ncbi:MAG: FecR domain-containing protein, partial [Planctomycetota bacterium]
MSDTPDVPPTLSDAVDAAIDRGETAAIATIDELLKRPGTEAGLEILRTVRIDAKLVRSVRDESDHALARRLLVDDAVSRRSPSKARRTGRRQMIAAAFTASAAVALLISVASLLPRPAAASVGRVVAVAEGTVWADGAGPLGVDDAIDADRVIELTEGFVTVEVGRDVSIDLVGPVRARIDAERIVRLDEGLLAGVVGPAGRGFTVTTEDATVVDLGTRFQVHKDRASGTQVRVTSGRVEATLRRDDGGDAKVLDLVAGESARFDATTGLVDGLEALFDFETAYAPVEGAKGDVRRFAGA